jgi:DNA-binding CsgD family transcriptional regulator
MAKMRKFAYARAAPASGVAPGRLTERGARAALAMLAGVGTATSSVESFARAGVHALPALVGADLTTLSLCALGSGKRRVTGFPEKALAPADIACFDRFFFAHPLVRFHSAHHEGGTHRISDSLPDAAFHHSALYAEYYRKIGIEHAVAVPLFVDGDTLVSFVLNRTGRDFSAAECATLEAVRAPLVMLYRKALALDEAAAMIERFRAWIDTEGWCEIEVDTAFRIRRAGRRALAMLGAAVPETGLRSGAMLPAVLSAWLARAHWSTSALRAPVFALGAARRAHAGGPAGIALTLDAGARRFALRALPAIAGDGWLLYVGEKAPPEAVDALTRADLSPREREVLEWVAAGKSDAQAAAILGISVRTVHKHLEHIYAKLGVEGRTAAVMRARAAAAK